MSEGRGGWVVTLHCVGCDAEDMFRGVLLTFAGDAAIKAGWLVEATTQVLAAAPGKRGELCPKCAPTLG